MKNQNWLRSNQTKKLGRHLVKLHLKYTIKSMYKQTSLGLVKNQPNSVREIKAVLVQFVTSQPKDIINELNTKAKLDMVLLQPENSYAMKKETRTRSSCLQNFFFFGVCFL